MAVGIDDYVAQLSQMNARQGSARAFARTVRGIIDWRGQRQTFYQRAHELAQLPSMAVLWGRHDPIIPSTHAVAFAEYLDGVRQILFEDCGHYPHHEHPTEFVREIRAFFDDPSVPETRLRTDPTGGAAFGYKAGATTALPSMPTAV